MPLMPARVKYRKHHRGRRKGNAEVGNKVSFGEFGLKAIGRGDLTNIQIEAARVALTRHVKRGGKTWIRVFPDKSITKKPLETRMGKGKGILRAGLLSLGREGFCLRLRVYLSHWPVLRLDFARINCLLRRNL